jgi:Na+-driven multidrug efflux pump
MIFAPSLVKIFSSTPEVIRLGSLFLRWISPFYALCCVNQIYSGALRGAGNSRAAMIIMLTSFVGFRQLYLFIVSNYISNTIIPLAMAYPAGWLLASILVYSYYRRVNLEKNRLIEDSPGDQANKSENFREFSESKTKS